MGACCSSCLRQKPRGQRKKGQKPLPCPGPGLPRHSSLKAANITANDSQQGQHTRRSSARLISNGASSLTASLCSSDAGDYQSCQDAFSQSGSSPCSATSLRMSLDNVSPAQPQPQSLPSLRMSLDANVPRLPRPQQQDTTSPLPSLSGPPPPQQPQDCDHNSAEDHSSVGAKPSCLPQLLGRTLGAFHQAMQQHPAPAPAPAAAAVEAEAAGSRGEGGPAVQEGAAATRKCMAGASLQVVDDSVDRSSASMSCEDGHGPHYSVRSTEYMSTKIKIPSDPSIYELVTADTFSFERKQRHIAQLVQLPPCGPPVTLDSGTVLPQLLVINIQIPTYAPSIFGRTDGPGCSIVFYFRLRPDFDPSTFPNQAAMRLFERFLLDGKEADGACTRDRFKLIGQVVNVDQWAQAAPLSSAEHKLLTAYNEKPLLTRPQHTFIRGDSYLEIDIDIHAYSYIAKKAFQAYVSRLGPVVFENAFVIQGNSCDELPEQVLAAGRIYRVDLSKLAPLSSYLTSPLESASTPTSTSTPTSEQAAP